MRARPGVVEAVEAAAEAYETGGLVVFEAPTGYGKTTATPLLYKRIRESYGHARIVHGLPLRAIVEQAAGYFRDELICERVGYQAGGLILSGKTPFYGADVVVSTLDSLAMTLARWSLGEPDRLGHYEVPRAHLLSSMIVLDEAHLPFQPNPFTPESASTLASRAATTMAGLAYALSHYHVPILVETATLPRKVREFITARYKGPNRVECITVDKPGGGRPPEGCRVVEDKEYFETVERVEWSYHSLRGLEEAVAEAARRAETGEKVFLAATRVKDAVDAYMRLRERLGDGVVLVHGRMAASDREAAVGKLRRATVLVGTPAVEAGVDYDADTLLTDIPGGGSGWVAWESLLQRMGRVARNPRGGRRARIVFYGPGSREAAQAMEGVNPRIPSSYRKLIDGREPPKIDSDLLDSYLRLTIHFVESSEVESLREKVCNPMRDNLLTQIVIPVYPVEPGREADLEHVLKQLDAGMVVTTSLSEGVGSKGWLLERDGSIVVLAREWEAVRGHPQEAKFELREVPKHVLAGAVGKCGRLGRGVFLEALIAKPDAYRTGVGLV